MDTTKIKIEATISADQNKVWDCWTKPEHITKWNFASDDWHCPEAENDLRAGGKYRARMEAVYDEVIPQQKIAYTMTDGRQAITNFERQGNKTKVTTVFDAEKENSIDMQKDGWQAILNNFKKHVENN